MMILTDGDTPRTGQVTSDLAQHLTWETISDR